MLIANKRLFLQMSDTVLGMSAIVCGFVRNLTHLSLACLLRPLHVIETLAGLGPKCHPLFTMCGGGLQSIETLLLMPEQPIARPWPLLYGHISDCTSPHRPSGQWRSSAGSSVPSLGSSQALWPASLTLSWRT